MPASLLAYLQEFGFVPPADHATLLAVWHGREAAEGEYLTAP